MIAQLAEDRLSASFIADEIQLFRAHTRVGRTCCSAKGLAAEYSDYRCHRRNAEHRSPGLGDFAGMSIEHAADGSVREPGRPMLAGSALWRLDQAVRNIVAWGSPARGAGNRGMAFERSTGGGIGCCWAPPSTIDWDETLTPRTVSVGDVTINNRVR